MGTGVQNKEECGHRHAEQKEQLVLAGMGHLETLVEVDVRCMFSILGLDSVLELWFQTGNWQFTEQRTERGSECASWDKQQVTHRKGQPKCHLQEALPGRPRWNCYWLLYSFALYSSLLHSPCGRVLG